MLGAMNTKIKPKLYRIPICSHSRRKQQKGTQIIYQKAPLQSLHPLHHPIILLSYIVGLYPGYYMLTCGYPNHPSVYEVIIVLLIKSKLVEYGPSYISCPSK